MHANSQQAPRKKRKLSKALKIGIPAAAVVIAVALIVVSALLYWRGTVGSEIDSTKYQAVFLTSGQVYFGKLDANAKGDYYKLSDVFYIQASDTTTATEDLQDADTAPTDLQLIKLGSEVHGPEDEMLISKDQILFVENLKDDGKVTDSIKKYRAELGQ